MEPRVIFLQGPPGAGKDAIGTRLAKLIPHSKVVKFAAVLKERTHALYGCVGHDGEPLRHDYYDAVKDRPSDCFLGLTPRQAYIAVSETYFKPQHGADVFGRLLLDQMIPESGQVYIITDSGFAAEAEPIFEKFGSDLCVIVQIHRAGHDFSKDSRNYWKKSRVRIFNFFNDGPIEELDRDSRFFAEEIFPSINTAGPAQHEPSSCAGPRPNSDR